MSIFDKLPKEFTPLVVLGDIDGYLYVFSHQDDEVVHTLVSMALDALESKDYESTNITLQ